MFHCFSLRMTPYTRCSIGPLTCVVLSFCFAPGTLMCPVELVSLCRFYAARRRPCYTYCAWTCSIVQTTGGCCVAICTVVLPSTSTQRISIVLFFCFSFMRSSFNHFPSVQTHLFMHEKNKICYTLVYRAGCPPTSTCFVSGGSVSFP